MTFYHLYRHLHTYGTTHKPLYFTSLMLFFWCTFDGIVTYLTPLVIIQNGFSETVMGMIIGSSSIAGAFFDFLLSKYLPNTHYRRIYLGMFALSFFYPFMLFKANTIWLYLCAMAMWGLYYDLANFGNFDFISRETKKDEHASSFGVFSVFRSLGYLLAPLLAGLVVGDVINWEPFLLAWIFLIIAFLLFLLIVRNIPKSHHEAIPEIRRKPSGLFMEFTLWGHIQKAILPLLLLTTLLYIQDATIWTIGPLLAEELSKTYSFGALLLVVFSLPSLLIGWFVGPAIKRYGKRQTAFYPFCLGSLLLTSLLFLQGSPHVFPIAFISSSLIAFSLPSLNGLYVDYITQKPEYENEVEGIVDLFTNLGYVIGPILAGFMADMMNYAQAFAFIGLSNATIAFFLSRIHLKRTL